MSTAVRADVVAPGPVLVPAARHLPAVPARLAPVREARVLLVAPEVRRVAGGAGRRHLVRMNITSHSLGNRPRRSLG